MARLATSTNRWGGWQLTATEESRAAARQLRSAATEAMGDFIRDLQPWTLFATLTFDPNKETRANGRSWVDGRESFKRFPAGVTDVSAVRRFGYWLEESQLALNRQTAGVVALEHHKSGQPHGHGLLAISGDLRGHEIKTLSQLWRSWKGNGRIRLEFPRSAGDVAGYCAKYMTKDAGEIVFSRSIRL